MEGKWTLDGYNPAEEKIYPIPGEFNTEDEACEAARKRITERGSQDYVFIIRPDGSRYRFPSELPR